MSGYVPLFDSLTKGTLCGRWPDIGLWPIVLSLSDKHGVVDVTPAFIAGVTGLTVEDVTACMRRFCEPDPYSRSPAEGGSRLVLLDDHREWGWQIVNHSSYREKARKSAYDADRTASGRDRDRKAASRAVPTRPGVSGAVPLSDSDANTDSNKEKRSDTSAPPPSLNPVEQVFTHWQAEWNHPNAKLDHKRQKRIEARLKDFTVEQLRDAITGYKHSPWHTGTDPKGNGVVYDGIETLLQDTAHVETGLRLLAHPPRPPPKLEQLSPVERVLRANGVTRDDRVVAEQSGSSNVGLGDVDRDVRQPDHAGFRRLGS